MSGASVDAGRARSAAVLPSGLKFAWAGTVLVVLVSLVFGLSVLPALLFWESIRALPLPNPSWLPIVRSVLVAMSLIPAYLIFCIVLMALNAALCRLLGWRTTPGVYSSHDYSPALVRWASYNASINVVRLFAGEALRATPLWTLYLKWNGAKIGKGVYVNSARLFDHNLLDLGEKAVVGGDAKLIAHLVEGGEVRAYPVVLGKRAVVGVNAVISPGVEIGDRSAVGAMSFVPKHQKIPANEIWGGVPAKLIKQVVAVDEGTHVQPGMPIAS